VKNENPVAFKMSGSYPQNTVSREAWLTQAEVTDYMKASEVEMSSRKERLLLVTD
jgi:hypothetical protein